jgi:hypothetical protein
MNSSKEGFMKAVCIGMFLISLVACAAQPVKQRGVATADQTGEITIKNKGVKFTIIDRGWRTETGATAVNINDQGQVVFGGFPTIEAVKSYLIIYEASSAKDYNAIKVESALKATEQCQNFGNSESDKTMNQLDGYKTTVSSKIVNNLEMPASFTFRYVCLVSVLAAKN